MGRQLLEFNGESDPFHLLLGLPSNLVLSCFVKSFNTTPYRFLRREFASTITRVHRHKPVPWGRAYFFLKRWKASLTFVKQDIEEQEISEENGFLYLTSQGLWLKHWLPERIESHSTKKLFFCCKLTQ
ncbi:transposase [Candidatus Methylacidiphilum fumarolicum]|nr:transposase [Candidatus Methylacidiphilum fumarolicum]